MRPGSSHASVATAWRLRIAATAQLQYQPARTSSGSTIVVTAVPRQCAACPRPPASHKIAREVRRPWILGEREHRVDELPDRGRLRRRERGPTGVPASRKPYEGKQNCTRACCRPGAAAGRCRAAHARAAGNQRLLARGAAHLVCAGGRYPAHAGRVGARLLLPAATAVGDVALVDGQEISPGIIASSRNEEAEDLYDIARPEACFAVGCASLGTFSRRFTELVGVPPSVYRRQAVRATAGMPSWVAKQVTRTVRNREAPAREPHLGWLSYGDRPRQEGGKA
jgi:hypothetical protein